ncbi:MAG: hypothetical protein DSZ06_04510 [Sulfurospirillum sp.]|nr:MAG: hypothetical protein DSZ06_04510 [Sulfurospirillum sp.]
MYSYKKPRNKPLLDKSTKMWIVFFSFVLFGVIGYGIFLQMKTSGFNEKIADIQKINQKKIAHIKKLENELKELKFKQVVVRESEKSNKLLNNSIKNLFNLIPDQITLSKVLMKKDSLRLEGYSCTKDAYRLLLEPALKAIFVKSDVKFDFIPRVGKYKFVSVNKSEIKLYKKDKDIDNGKR